MGSFRPITPKAWKDVPRKLSLSTMENESASVWGCSMAMFGREDPIKNGWSTWLPSHLFCIVLHQILVDVLGRPNQSNQRNPPSTHLTGKDSHVLLQIQVKMAPTRLGPVAQSLAGNTQAKQSKTESQTWLKLKWVCLRYIYIYIYIVRLVLSYLFPWPTQIMIQQILWGNEEKDR